MRKRLIAAAARCRDICCGGVLDGALRVALAACADGRAHRGCWLEVPRGAPLSAISAGIAERGFYAHPRWLTTYGR